MVREVGGTEVSVEWKRFLQSRPDVKVHSEPLLEKLRRETRRHSSLN